MISIDSDLSREYWTTWPGDRITKVKLDCYPGTIGFMTKDRNFYDPEWLFYTYEEAKEDLIDDIDSQINDLLQLRERVLNDIERY